MFKNTKAYGSPLGYSGIGSDIDWCERWKGGKFCMYCRSYAKFNDWSKNWHWYYLTQWRDNTYGWSYYYWQYSHFKMQQYFQIPNPNFQRNPLKTRKPQRYVTTGLKDADLKSLLKKGCKLNRKCKCVSVSQRGAWYCPECYSILTKMAQHYKRHFHDLTIINRDSLKEDVLILLLSGTI